MLNRAEGQKFPLQIQFGSEPAKNAFVERLSPDNMIADCEGAGVSVRVRRNAEGWLVAVPGHKGTFYLGKTLQSALFTLWADAIGLHCSVAS